MTDTERYAEAIKGLGEALANKNIIIFSQEYEINSLREKIAELEKDKEKMLQAANAEIEVLQEKLNELEEACRKTKKGGGSK